MLELDLVQDIRCKVQGERHLPCTLYLVPCTKIIKVKL